jgi:hypothetical protein
MTIDGACRKRRRDYRANFAKDGARATVGAPAAMII